MRFVWPMLLFFVSIRCQKLAIDPAFPTEYCKATSFSTPGFRSPRSIFPEHKALWDNVNKVSFQNKDGTWLAGNFKDTGSAFVVVMFGGATAHKEAWPLPDLARTLANDHGLSSIAVDIAGRGESCGYEVGPDCTSGVSSLDLRSRAYLCGQTVA